MDEGGIVYAITNGVAIKFGVTQRDAKTRCSALQTGSPLPLYVIAERPVENPMDLERALHRILSPFRMTGEWFVCSDPVNRAAEWLRNPSGSLREIIQEPEIEDETDELDNPDGADAQAQPRKGRPVRRDKVGGVPAKVAPKAAPKSGSLSQVERNRRWREKNREHYNEYMRRYRRIKK